MLPLHLHRIDTFVCPVMVSPCSFLLSSTEPQVLTSFALSQLQSSSCRVSHIANRCCLQLCIKLTQLPILWSFPCSFLLSSPEPQALTSFALSLLLVFRCVRVQGEAQAF